MNTFQMNTFPQRTSTGEINPVAESAGDHDPSMATFFKELAADMFAPVAFCGVLFGVISNERFERLMEFPNKHPETVDPSSES